MGEQVQAEEVAAIKAELMEAELQVGGTRIRAGIQITGAGASPVI